MSNVKPGPRERQRILESRHSSTTRAGLLAARPVGVAPFLEEDTPSPEQATALAALDSLVREEASLLAGRIAGFVSSLDPASRRVVADYLRSAIPESAS